MTKPDLVVFALDGTLIDTLPAYGHMAVTLLVNFYGLEFEDAVDRYLSTVGRPFVEQLELMCPDAPNNLTALSHFEMFKVDYQESIVGFTDSLEACKVLTKAEIPLGVVSSTSRAFCWQVSAICLSNLRITAPVSFSSCVSRISNSRLTASS